LPFNENLENLIEWQRWQVEKTRRLKVQDSNLETLTEWKRMGVQKPEIQVWRF
jgi:hypothetical protein